MTVDGTENHYVKQNKLDSNLELNMSVRAGMHVYTCTHVYFMTISKT